MEHCRKASLIPQSVELEGQAGLSCAQACELHQLMTTSCEAVAEQSSNGNAVERTCRKGRAPFEAQRLTGPDLSE